MQEFKCTGQEIWKLEGKQYHVLETAIVGGQLFLVRAFVDYVPSKKDRKTALSIAQFALVKGYRQNSKSLRFYNDFANVSDEYIGISLVTLVDEEKKEYRFTFKTSDILVKGLKEGVVTRPDKLDDNREINNLNDMYWNSLKNNNPSYYYYQLSLKQRDSIDYNELVKNYKLISDSIANYRNLGFSHSIFIGNGSNGKMFKYYFKVSGDVKGFFVIQLSEKDSDYTVDSLNVLVSEKYKF